MRQAIETKFLGPTDYHGARIIAKCEARRITVNVSGGIEGNRTEDYEDYEGYDYEGYCHRYAATLLAQKMGWVQTEKGPACSNMLRGGKLPGKGERYAFLVLMAPNGDDR